MNASPDQPKYTLAYVAGAGHCGSTLLNLLLNAHSRILGLSEVYAIVDLLRAQDPVFRTPFWRSVARRYEQSTGSALAEIDITVLPAARVLRGNTGNLEDWLEPNRALLECLAIESGADVLVDASKSWQRLALLSKSRAFDLRVIHLIRDGRAVYNSYQRKYRSPMFALTKWPKFTIAALLLRRGFDESSWLDLRYEDLCANPEKSLIRVCGFLGLEYESSMLRFREQSNFGLGGNRMANGSDQAIRLDERWRTELNSTQRVLFTVLFGWLNRLLGYR